jgi:hypothetical protein
MSIDAPDAGTDNRAMTKPVRATTERATVSIAIAGFVFMANGRENAGDSDDTSSRVAVTAEIDPRVGLVAGRVIRRSEIEAAVSLQLFDLELQRYRLLRQTLEVAALETIEEASESDRVGALELEPPVPVRVDVVIDPARTRPDVGA